MASDDDNKPARRSSLWRKILTLAGIVLAYVLLRSIFYRLFDDFHLNHEYAQDAALVCLIVSYLIGRVAARRRMKK